MAAVTADIPLRVSGNPVYRKYIVDSSIAQTWYKGEPMIIDQSADTVNVTPVHDVTHPVVAATDVFVGIAAEGGSFVVSAPEGLEKTGVECFVEPTVLGFKSTVYTNADIGATVYFVTGVLGSTAGDTAMIGTLQFVADGYAYVKLITAICTGA